MFGSIFSISDTLNHISPSVLIKAVRHEGYVRSFDSLSNYLKSSLELLNEETYSTLFSEDWPIYTKSYDTAPVLYKKGGSATNSYIANGSIIEGTVINSILGRGVRVKKGAVLKNAIIGSDASISENIHIENAIVDKEAQVIHVKEVVGTADNPLYIAQGDIV